MITNEPLSYAILLALLLVVGALLFLTFAVFKSFTPPPVAKPTSKPEPVEQDTSTPPMYVDPEDPPRWMIYRNRSGKPRVCSCHQRTLSDGQDILWWPVENGVVVIFCADGAKQA